MVMGRYTAAWVFQRGNKESISTTLFADQKMKYLKFIKIIILSLGFASSFAYGQKTSVYNMDEIRDVDLFELEVLQDWHPVATTPPTRQKIVEITLCDFENGRKVRIPVSYVVPDADRPCHFIVSAGNLGPTVYKEFDSLQTKMLENGVGFVLSALGRVKRMKPGGAQLEAEMNQLFKKTFNINIRAFGCGARPICEPLPQP